jgi:drug/metabolite transporter (DMT)-like permease
MAARGGPAARPDAPNRAGLGLGLALASAATFGSSGAFGKSLLAQGWTPGAVVTARLAGAALVLLPVVLVVMRGRWRMMLRGAPFAAAYGLVAVALCQFAYFNAVERLSVAVALLLEYLAPVLIVLILWVRGARPSRLTVAGVLLAMGGLVLVLDVMGGVRLSATGVLWGLLAAGGLVGYFLLSAHEHEDSLPPLALAWAGLVVGAVLLGGAGLLGALPMRATTADVAVGGHLVAWWVPVAELAVVAAAFAYAAGIGAVRLLGATVASFVMLTEVLFAVLLAWLLLGELPTTVQVAGGALIVAGVVAVRLAEVRATRADRALARGEDQAHRADGDGVGGADFAVPTVVP